MIIALDTEGTVTLINRRGCEILERPEEEVLGRNWVEQFIPERIRQEIDGAVRRMMGGEIEEFRRYENRVLTRDGEERDILWGNRAITGTDGRIVGILSSGEDITERKRAEEELRQALELNTAVLESISDSFLMLDKEWRFIYSNRRALGYSGKDPADVIGRSVWEVFPEILGTPLEAFYRTAMESRDPLTYENRSVVVTGRTFELRSYPTAGGLSIFGTDITERMRSEEVLRETRDYLDSLINYANAPIIVWDPKSRITRFNAAFEHLSGHAADEVIGRDLVMLFPEESREESLEKIQRTITERWQSVEIPILRPDGDVRIALWNSANIYDRSGTTLLATIAQGQDITDRKHAEEALRGYAENLQRSNDDLERFAYVASHDLQEPLRSIVSFSQLLDRRYRGQLGTDADEYIEFIVEGGTRMQGLILDLLAFSRVNTTRQQITQTDAEDVLAEAVRALNVSLRESGATLTHDPLPVVMADPTQLAQVFANLVSNAVKFRKPDEPLQIHVGVRHTDGFCEFSVSDNGIGIEPEYFDKIFVIFQRLHTKETYPGTGIGLAIVKRIIDRHGGTVRVESTPGEGSTFFFTLPAASRINPPITPSDHF